MIGSYSSPLSLLLDFDLRFRFGWRWAFLIQMPLFAISLFLTGINLNYVTPVRYSFRVSGI